MNCTRCGYVSSQDVCKACVLLEGLNKGLPRLGIGKSSKVKRILEENEKRNQNECCKTKNSSCCAAQNKCCKEAQTKNTANNISLNNLLQ